MNNIHLHKAYKIVEKKHKKYSEHYSIPAGECLVVPLKDYGADVCCDVRWEDSNGELQLKQNVIFTKEYLMPIQPLLDQSRQEMWEHFYHHLQPHTV